MSGTIRKIVIAVVIVALLFIAYSYFFVSSPTPNLEVSGVAVSGGSQAGRDFLIALVNLEHINLDIGAAILNDQAFARLEDMSVSLPNEKRGRSNPFGPIGAGAADLAGTPVEGNKLPIKR